MKIDFFYIIFIFTFISCENQNERSVSKSNINTEILTIDDTKEFEKTKEYSSPKLIQKSEDISKYKIGKINDPDGFSNLRIDKSSKSKIVSKIFENEYFFYLPIKTKDWYKVKDLKGNIGFIHKSRILEVSNNDLFNITFTAYDKKTKTEFRKDSIIEYNDLEKAFRDLWELQLNYKSIPVVNETINSITLKGDNTQVKFIKEEFNSEQRVGDYKFWGTDGNTPKYQYEKIEVIENGVTYNIPNDKLRDLFEPTLDKNYIEVFTNLNDQTILKLSNSDGAGAYIAVFILENMEVKKRIVYLPF